MGRPGRARLRRNFDPLALLSFPSLLPLFLPLVVKLVFFTLDILSYLIHRLVELIDDCINNICVCFGCSKSVSRNPSVWRKPPLSLCLGGSFAKPTTTHKLAGFEFRNRWPDLEHPLLPQLRWELLGRWKPPPPIFAISVLPSWTLVCSWHTPITPRCPLTINILKENQTVGKSP